MAPIDEQPVLSASVNHIDSDSFFADFDSFFADSDELEAALNDSPLV